MYLYINLLDDGPGSADGGVYIYIYDNGDSQDRVRIWP